MNSNGCSHDAEERMSLETNLSESVADVLGVMFFAEAVPQGDASPFHDLDAVNASVAFGGDRRGIMSLSVSRGCLRRLASNFLGTESEDDVREEDGKQVLCELANMICGAFLSRTDPTGNFLIAPPQCPAEEMPEAADLTRSYEVEGGSIEIQIAWTEGV